MPRRPDSPDLSIRELQVLRLVAAGKTCREIASRLGVGYYTVRTHLRQLSRVLDVTNRYEAVAEARRRGMVFPLPPVDVTLATEYQRRVLALVAGGMTNSDVARVLFLSEETVKVHVREGIRRLGLSSRTELIRRWPRHVAVSRAS